MIVQPRPGVRVPIPDRPRRHKAYWTRRAPTLLMAGLAHPLSRILGGERTRTVLNRLAGKPIWTTDRRLMPDGQLGTFGIILAPGGCEWAIPEHGGCTFCSFQDAVDGYVGTLPLDAKEFTALFMAGFHSMRKEVDMVAYFSAGSALNRGEIPEESMLRIARAVADAPKTRWLRVESRVQYMDEAYMYALTKVLETGNAKLDIAVGFETLDDRLRNKLMNKGMSRKGFERAVEQAKAAGVRMTCYVMLKGHWIMGERFAIEECVRSIQYLNELGIDEVQLQPLYVSPNGDAMHQAWLKSLVRPPWLWSVIEVLARTVELDTQVVLGPWQKELPTPVDAPRNCEQCTPKILRILDSWRQHGNRSIFVDHAAIPLCSCHNNWQEECATSADPPSDEDISAELLRRKSLCHT